MILKHLKTTLDHARNTENLRLDPWTSIGLGESMGWWSYPLLLVSQEFVHGKTFPNLNNHGYVYILAVYVYIFMYIQSCAYIYNKYISIYILSIIMLYIYTDMYVRYILTSLHVGDILQGVPGCTSFSPVTT